jgi:hypothetical protein
LIELREDLLKQEEERRKERLEFELLQIKYKDSVLEVEKLKKDLEREKKRVSKTIYNIKVQQVINQLPALTSENIKGSFLEHVSIDSVKGGATRFVGDFTNMAKTYSKISDISRGKLISKDDKGDKLEIQCEPFIRKLFKECEEKGIELTEAALEEMKTKEEDPIFDKLTIQRTNEIHDIKKAFKDSKADRQNPLINKVSSMLKKEGNLIQK